VGFKHWIRLRVSIRCRNLARRIDELAILELIFGKHGRLPGIRGLSFSEGPVPGILKPIYVISWFFEFKKDVESHQELGRPMSSPVCLIWTHLALVTKRFPVPSSRNQVKKTKQTQGFFKASI